MAKKLSQKPKTVQAETLPPDAAEFKTGFAKWLPMIVLSVALMIIIIDTTVLNVSIRNIVNDIGTNIQGIQWVITGYALTLAALTITGGRLGDLFGRKKMFMLGAAIFAIGSFITSISHSLGMLLVGEAVIEGVGAALMMPATASLLVSNYKGRDRAIAFGIWGGIAGAASAIGPVLGGYLTTNFSWRWAFRINIIIAALLLVGSFFIAESLDRAEERKLDFVGVLLSAGGLLAFVYGVIESSTYGWWSARTSFDIFHHSFAPWGLSIAPFAMALGVVLLIAFGLWEKRVEAQGRTPLMSLKLLANKQFTSGTATVALMSLGMTGLIFSLPIFLQSVQNLDALHTGLALLPMSIAVLIAAPGSAALAKHITAKRLIQTGLFITVLASALLRSLISPTASVMHLAPGLALFGLGMGLVFAQSSNLALSAVSVEQSGEASGVNNTIRQIGTSFGSAIIGAVVLTTLASGLSTGVLNSSVIPVAAKPALAQQVSQQASNVELGGVGKDKATRQLSPQVTSELTRIAHQASSDGSRKAIAYTGVFLLAALAVSTALPNTHDLEKRGREGAPVAAAH
ncbi:MAG: DHA2 family efflux MFS transporter permease subunit [Candidatus Saccharimonadales bacterium]